MLKGKKVELGATADSLAEEVVRARRTHDITVRPLSPPRSCWGASASMHWPVPSKDATSPLSRG